MSTAFHRDTTRLYMQNQPSYEERKKLDTCPDPHPKWLFGCLIKCNRKCTNLPVVPSIPSIIVIRAKVSKLQIKVICYDKEDFYII